MNSVIGLLAFLNAEKDPAVDTLTPALAAAGVDVGLRLGAGKGEAGDGAPAARSAILIKLAAQALGRVLDGFDKLIDVVKRRIQRAQRLRRLAALATTILSSGVVASLNIAKGSGWSLGLGILALLASILTLIAGWLEGGDAKLAKSFSEVSTKYAQALALNDRLEAYAAAPSLFPDVEARLSEADQLASELQRIRAEWSIS